MIPEADSNILDFEEITPEGREGPRTFRFNRLLAIEPYHEILDEDQPISFAGANATWPSYHALRGTVNANLLSGEFSLVDDSANAASNFITFCIHGIGMILLVGIGFPLEIDLTN
jgi:hypothetical protein